MTDICEGGERSGLTRRMMLKAGAAMSVLASAGPAWPQGETSPEVLITGTSSGFGRLMAESFARGGAHVIATMRDVAGRNADGCGGACRIGGRRPCDRSHRDRCP